MTRRFLKNKIIIFFALILIFPGAGCTNIDNLKSKGNTGNVNNIKSFGINNVNDDFAVANITIFGNNSEVKANNTLSDGVLVSISGTYVTTDEFNVYLYAAEKDYERYFGEEIFDYKYSENETIGELLKEKILEYVISVKFISETADSENVYLTSEELLAVDASVAAFIEKNGSILNKEAVRKVYSDGFLAKKYYDTFNGNEEEFFSSVRVRTAEKEIFLNSSEWDAL